MEEFGVFVVCFAWLAIITTIGLIARACLIGQDDDDANKSWKRSRSRMHAMPYAHPSYIPVHSQVPFNDHDHDHDPDPHTNLPLSTAASASSPASNLDSHWLSPDHDDDIDSPAHANALPPRRHLHPTSSRHRRQWHCPCPYCSASSSFPIHLHLPPFIARYYQRVDVAISNHCNPCLRLVVKCLVLILTLCLLHLAYVAWLEPSVHFYHTTAVAYHSRLGSVSVARPLCPPILTPSLVNGRPLRVVFTSDYLPSLPLARAAIQSTLDCTSLSPTFVWSHPTRLLTDDEVRSFHEIANRFESESESDADAAAGRTPRGHGSGRRFTLIQEHDTADLLNGLAQAAGQPHHPDLPGGNVVVGQASRMELPRLFPDEDFILYADTDTLFIRDYDWQALVHETIRRYPTQPFRLAIDSDLYFLRGNTGLFIMQTRLWAPHLPAWRSHLITPLAQSIWREYSGDQGNLLYYLSKHFHPTFNYPDDEDDHAPPLLPPELNWKTYWGYHPVLYGNVVALHFHGSSKYTTIRQWLITDIDRKQNYHTRAPANAEARALALLDFFVARAEGNINITLHQLVKNLEEQQPE